LIDCVIVVIFLSTLRVVVSVEDIALRKLIIVIKQTDCNNYWFN